MATVEGLRGMGLAIEGEKLDSAVIEAELNELASCISDFADILEASSQLSFKFLPPIDFLKLSNVAACFPPLSNLC